MKRASIALVAINALTLLLALVGLGYSIYVVATEGKLCEDCLAIPVVWGWSAFGLTLCVAFVSLLSVVAACKHIKTILIFMAFFTFVTFAASVALTVILSMWTSQTDLGALSGVVLDLESQLKLFLAKWALTNANDWIELQTSLQCCGVGLEAVYSYSIAQLHTGPLCTVTADAAIAQHMQYNPDYTQSLDVQFNEQLRQLNGDVDYFCEAKVRATLQSSTLYVAIVLGVLSLIQLVAFVLDNYLICCVAKADGGFAEIDFETGKLETPMTAMVNNTKEITQESKQMASRVSTRVGLGIAHSANRVSMQFGFQPPINEERFKPPPGMPPPGLGGRGGGPPPPGIVSVDVESGGGAVDKDFGPEYAKYERMKKSGLPSGAVRNAMERDGVAVPAGFLDEDAAPVAAAAVRKPAPPPVQAVKNFANRVSSRVQKSTNRMSVNVKGMFAPPPPPPGFGGLPAETSAPPPGMFGGGGATETGFGGATSNPNFRGGAMPTFDEQPVPVAVSKPPAPAPKAAKAAPAAPPKAAAKAKPAPAAKAAAPAPAAKKPAGGPGFLADIGGGGGGFQLKKTVTHDRSAPNFSA